MDVGVGVGGDGGDVGAVNYARVYGGAIRLSGGSGQCLECGRRFGKYQRAVRHYRTVHAVSGCKASCYICQRSYKNDQTLKEHLRATHGIFQRDLPKARAAAGGEGDYGL